MTDTALDRLRAAHPWPDIAGVPTYHFGLDGGGRDLVTTLICQRNVRVMLEIGCFLGGSAREWLDASPDIVLVGIDPWTGDTWPAHLRRYLKDFPGLFGEIADPEAFIASVEAHGPFLSALAAMRGFEDRFIPVRDRSPQILPTLKELGLEPELVYIDSGKTRDDLDAVRALWPDAMICGDDWTWGADQGFPMQTAVKAFAAEHGVSVEAKRATWVITG